VNKKPSPAKSIQQLEDRDNSRDKRRYWQFGLGKFILATNLLGLALAAIVSTRGYAIPIAISIGVLAGFLAPMLVMLRLAALAAWERVFGRKPLAVNWQSKLNEESNDPFVDP